MIEFAYDLPPERYRLSPPPPPPPPRGGPAWAKRGGSFECVRWRGGAASRHREDAGWRGAFACGIPPRVAGDAGGSISIARPLRAEEPARLRPGGRAPPPPPPPGSGSKLVENRSDAKETESMADGPPFRIRAVHAPVSTLVEDLSSPNHGVGRPVIDKTGLPPPPRRLLRFRDSLGAGRSGVIGWRDVSFHGSRETGAETGIGYRALRHHRYRPCGEAD